MGWIIAFLVFVFTVGAGRALYLADRSDGQGDDLL
jgi:hypothetical protein